MNGMLFTCKTALSLTISTTLLAVSMQSAQATLLTPSQTPLILSESVAPNLILTLDNSGSMFYARVPDDPEGISESDANRTALRSSRRVKSSYYNPMYYNPNVTYTLPVKFNTDGSRAASNSQYTSTFTNAPNNGFLANTTTGFVNLSNDYKVSWSYNTASGRGSNYGESFTSSRLAENPDSDFYLNTTKNISLSNGGSRDFTEGNFTFTVTRINSSTCTATISAPSYMPAPTCSKDGSNYTVTSDARQAGVPAYYYVFDTTLNNCPTNTSQQKNNDNCYRLQLVSSSEQTNFARWYSFYRSRNLATLSAANISFIGLPSSIRLTWQTLRNSCSSFDGSDSECNSNQLRKFSQTHRGNYFNWLPTITFDSGGTFLHAAMKRAGDYISTSNDPWAYDPNKSGGTVQTPEYSCRANYHILMTDGIWNNAASAPSSFRPDQTSVTLPDNTTYTPLAPYNDATNNTVADLAFHYWATDARTGLANDLKPIIQAPNATASTQYWDPRNDPATWQHLTTFAVGLGLNASLSNASIPWTGETHGGSGYSALMSGTAWPAAGDGSENNVYDLWHAALNSRGEFFSADTPDAIVTAFQDIISRISNRTTSAGAPGVTASIVQDALNREVYETKFNSEDWSGDLTKFNISEAGVRTARWSAQTQVDAQTPSSRNIKFYSATATNNLQDFTWDNLSSAEQAMLNRNFDSSTSPADTRGSERVAYIRGDQSQEGSASGAFRIRSSVLGDIVNSSPVIVAAPKYISYLADKIDGSAGDYEAFKTANASRAPMVYVGSNDGMLHGFNVNTGQEAFAFVPRAVMPNLYKLTSQRYTGGQHNFFVDGTPTVADVYYDDAWHTVLVGTLRAGGRSIFALDITNPSSIKLLWEKSSSDAGFANLGYTFAQPVIARLHTGKWAVVTGNGYGNQDGATADVASLMVLDIKTGAMEKEMVVTGDSTVANGLSSPRLADNNSDGIADYAYAGDLQGNLWRFDLVPTLSTAINGDPFNKTLIGNINASSFAVAYGGRPLYTALDDRTSGATSQAITAPPSLVRHPSGTGYIVAFGTGKYFESTDANVDSTRAMTLYGIWDEKTRRQPTSAPSSALNRSNLQQQTITSQPSNPFSSNNAVQGIRIVSDNAVDWTTKKGWYLDLKVGSTRAGEMMINPMAARGKTLLLSTLTPNSNPCQEGVESWLYGLDATTGGRTRYNVFDLNNDKIISNQDMASVGGTNTVVSSYKKPGSGGFTTNTGDIFTAPSQGGGVKYSGGPGSSGRQSWRVIPED